MQQAPKPAVTRGGTPPGGPPDPPAPPRVRSASFQPRTISPPGARGRAGGAGDDTSAGAAIDPASRAALLFLLPPEHPRRRRTTALWLCLFLGWAGSHRFYVGKRDSGRLYLFTGGLMLVGVLVDLARILSGTFTDRFGNPLD